MSSLDLPRDAPAALRSLAADFTVGKKAALARAVSIVENGRPGSDVLLAAMHSRVGRARRIGLTGPPGAGKSTITTLLAAELRKAGFRVGIVAVDPTSPFTGGALLGDRVRMESVALDPGVFIRSMATRGSLGGLAGATREVCDVLDAFGIDRILVETVGVGQSELDIARTVDSSVVVLVPESGDSIQTLKAGVMEIADIFVVNKADRPGADRLRSDLELMLGLRGGLTLANTPAHHGVDLSAVANPAKAARAAAARVDPDEWTPPVLRTVGTTGEGVGELLASLDRHFAYLERSGALQNRRRTRLRERVVDVAEQRMRRRLWTDAATKTWLDERIPELEAGRTSPYAVAEALLARSGDVLAKDP
ncbi:MAG TPA: methylmalonyl Co-A mutase-associated GTPase MeaB [Gemmatimonadaceae bacterium]|nr:methylmalonyl Co-A mutase-associated GTPase MeaB [Gemmatimonadaceae bacterium]